MTSEDTEENDKNINSAVRLKLKKDNKKVFMIKNLVNLKTLTMMTRIAEV